LTSTHRAPSPTRQSLLRYLAGLSGRVPEGPSIGTLADVPTELLTALLPRSGELGWAEEDRALLLAVLADDSRDPVRRAVALAQTAPAEPPQPIPGANHSRLRTDASNADVRHARR